MLHDVYIACGDKKEEKHERNPTLHFVNLPISIAKQTIRKHRIYLDSNKIHAAINKIELRSNISFCQTAMGGNQFQHSMHVFGMQPVAHVRHHVMLDFGVIRRYLIHSGTHILSPSGVFACLEVVNRGTTSVVLQKGPHLFLAKVFEQLLYRGAFERVAKAFGFLQSAVGLVHRDNVGGQPVNNWPRKAFRYEVLLDPFFRLKFRREPTNSVDNANHGLFMGSIHFSVVYAWQRVEYPNMFGERFVGLH